MKHNLNLQNYRIKKDRFSVCNSTITLENIKGWKLLENPKKGP